LIASDGGSKLKGIRALAELPADIAALSFEEALAELEKLVRQLEEGKGRLDEAIDAYSRGVLLKRHCEARLAEAQARVDRIVLGPDGAVSTQPLDLA
jgi:exodeoxyribonuclease VII small subunit